MEPELTVRPATSLGTSSLTHENILSGGIERRPSVGEKSSRRGVFRGLRKLTIGSKEPALSPEAQRRRGSGIDQPPTSPLPGVLQFGQGGNYTVNRNGSVIQESQRPLPLTPILGTFTTPRQDDFLPQHGQFEQSPLLLQQGLSLKLPKPNWQGAATLSPTDIPSLMQRPALSRAHTMDSAQDLYNRTHLTNASPFMGEQNGFNTYRSPPEESQNDPADTTTNMASTSSPAPAHLAGGAPAAVPGGTSAHLSGLMCNVHRTTGREPHALVGATTTILGDKLYVFGGKILSRTRASLTNDLHELDLVRRHWTKLETQGDIPPARYFHSMCALGDTKLVCYGGMSPQGPNGSFSGSQSGQDQPEVIVMSDIHIYDAPTNKWTYIPTHNYETPQGRYAHCATILPSSAVFTNSTTAPLSALQHNPPGDNPNQGSLGVNIDGTGGAEMVVVGGQDSGNHYIEQISVFNLRSLKWTRTQQLGKSCGAYRSVVAPLPAAVAAQIGSGPIRLSDEYQNGQTTRNSASSMLIYSNYNFLDVKLELQIRAPDGTLTEEPMKGSFTPPGLRFPNGGVVGSNFVVSGTYLTSNKQEYALWALDLTTLTWSRIDAGGAVFSNGSWNRGVLWNRRNTFVILGNRKRSLVEDYNHRRLNFGNICMVELEAFGLYDNPRKMTPMSGFVSASAPAPYAPLPVVPAMASQPWSAAGRTLSKAAGELGIISLGTRECADMDILAVGGERIPVNSRILSRRWGPYFIQLLKEGAVSQDGGDVATLCPPNTGSFLNTNPPSLGSQHNRNDPSRNSSLTITNFNGHMSTLSTSTTLANQSTDHLPNHHPNGSTSNIAVSPPEAQALLPTSRPRTLYLPHTHLTIQALLHFLYTSSLPRPSSPLCTPQILCSLLQLARPYRIDGLVEAVVERLHGCLESRNAAAVFNAAAMAAGGGRSLGGPLGLGGDILSPNHAGTDTASSSIVGGEAGPLRLNTQFAASFGRGEDTASEDGGSAVSEVASSNGWNGSQNGAGTDGNRSSRDRKHREPWTGDISAVIGLQKRGLRGLMEGRRLRERGASAARPPAAVGLGIT